LPEYEVGWMLVNHLTDADAFSRSIKQPHPAGDNIFP
jgi:hypothetical protein